jgi:hypothetical protein
VTYLNVPVYTIKQKSGEIYMLLFWSGINVVGVIKLGSVILAGRIARMGEIINELKLYSE